MKEATYTLHEPISEETMAQIHELESQGYRLAGNKLTVPYDESAPCVTCGLPVVEASVGGTAVCPWCDTGYYRDGCQWVYRSTATGLAPRFPHPEHLLHEGTP